MATQVQNRRGTTAQHSTFTGAVGEVTVDTDKEVVVVHDGTTAGGYPQMRENGSNSALALGSAGTPSLKFTGDTNTGIYSPGADQVAISTGGSGRLFVDASGRVGIGGSPTDALFVTGSVANFNVRSTSSSASTSIKWGNDLDTKSTEMWVNGSAVSTFGGASAFNVYQGAAAPILVSTNGSERLRITAAGLVGVGTSSPDAQLDVTRSGNGQIAVLQTSAGRGFNFESQSDTQIQLSSILGSTNLDLWANTVSLSAGGSQRLFVDSSGRVGVGTASPGYALTVSDGTRAGFIQPSSGLGSVNFGVATNHAMVLVTNDQERARIDASGRLGIGTSSPANTLHVVGTGRFINGSNPLIISTDSGDPHIFTESAAGLKLGTNSAVRMTINSSGSVGIGTTSPSSTFTVASSDQIALFSSINSNAYLRTTATTNDCAFGSDSIGGFFAVVNSAPLLLKTANTERARIDSSGRLLVGTSTSVLETVAIKGDGGGLQVCRLNSGFATTGQALGSIGFKGTTSPNSNAAAEVLIQAVAEENFSGTAAGSRLEFHTKANGVGPGSSPTERMRITNSGDVFIGTTTAGLANTTGFGFNQATNSSSYLNIGHASPSASGQEYLGFSYGGSQIGSIRQSGTTAVTYNTTSDYRLKENLIPIANAIGRIASIPTYRFNFISEPERTVDGFIAHEVQAIVPEAVTGEKDAVDADGNPIYQGIDQSKLVPLLTAALQEAIGEIESLKARVAALESA